MTAPTQAPTTVDLLVVLTRVETKIDAHASGLADHETRIRASEQTTVKANDLAPMVREQGTQAARIARLERWMWLAIGASASLGTVGGWLASGGGIH